MTYDTPVITSMKDDKIEGILRFTKHILRAAYIDGHMVEYFPWLQHLPSWIARWKKDVERWSWEYSKMFQGFYGSVKQRAVMTARLLSPITSDPHHMRSYRSREMNGQVSLSLYTRSVQAMGLPRKKWLGFQLPCRCLHLFCILRLTSLASQCGWLGICEDVLQ